MTMPSEPRHRHDLWTLFDVYRCTAEILIEANTQLPFALADVWLKLMRA
ncbi:hypothetical protein [Methylobacterium brachiatum]|nr:hypothetical protein [Methylobacterium brachiatum]MDH2313132.1 hypothetical protein [Methylobacterium brachiatum]